MTSANEMDQEMRAAVVQLLVIEVLKPHRHQTANPALALLGKKKNHWVFRLVIGDSITYVSDGEVKTCLSVRASVEPDEKNSWCNDLTLKPMANAFDASRSAFAHFQFDVSKKNLRVQDFVTAARSMLPFMYKIVARTIVPAQPKGKGRARAKEDRGEVDNHLNGCRDFTTQWFIECYRRGFVPWQSRELVPFHEIIGLRLGKGGISHGCPIAEAVFANYERTRQCLVEYFDQDYNRVRETVVIPYQTNAAQSVPVYEHYNYDELRQSAARREAGSSSRIDFRNQWGQR